MQQSKEPEVIMEQALEISEHGKRAAFLDDACRGDVDLRQEVESLINAYLEDDTFMTSPAEVLWRDMPLEREGDVIGRYRLLKQIGEGGFGTVYLAEQKQPVKRQIALKVIKPGMDSKEIIARFEAERQALAMMDHPHIAKVYDAGTTDGGRPYFAMELVNGKQITHYCNLHQLHAQDRLRLFIDVCGAIQHAHQKGIIHRDLKPSNILVSHVDGKAEVKVIDFGIAKAIGSQLTEKTLFTRHDRMIGTPQYMSPEQAEHNTLAIDTRSDIFSLGVILYELLTGTTPIDTDELRQANYSQIQRLICDVIPAKPSNRIAEKSSISARSLRGDLDWIVLKALEKEPARRYESAGVFAEDLQRYLQHKPVEARPPSVAYLMQRFTSRHRGAVFAGAALMMVLVLGAVGTSVGMKRAVNANEQLETKNTELIDMKERLAGLLESNQKMLSEISRMNINSGALPSEFETLRKENQTLLDKVSNEVANQERYTQQISRLQKTQKDLESSLSSQKQKHDNLLKEKTQLQSKLSGLHRALAMMTKPSIPSGSQAKNQSLSETVDVDAGEIQTPHTIVELTAEQVDETQTLGTLTLTPEQWRTVRTKYPQSPKRIPHLLVLSSPDRHQGLETDYAIEISRDRFAILHRSNAAMSIEDIRMELFRNPVTSLRTNERGQFHLNGKLIPFSTLLKALSIPPEKASLDEESKLIFKTTTDGKQATAPRWLGVKLPAGARPTDAVYHSRLQQLAAVADQIGLRHALLAN